MRRKAAIFVITVALLFAVGWVLLRVPYHKWRLRVCAENAVRVRQGKIRQTTAVATLLRGDPKTYQDYEAAIAKHEAALMRLNYFERNEFRLTKPVQKDKEKAAFLREAARHFPDRRTWRVVFSQSGDSVTVTTEGGRINQWEKFIRKFNMAG